MKRFLLLCLTFAMILSLLAGCGSKPEEESAAVDSVVETEKEQETPKQETDLPEQVENEETPDAPEETPKEQPEETPEEQPEETPKEEPEEEPEETPEQPEEEAVDYSQWIKVASYNIKCLLFSEHKDAIIEELREIDADLVGLQEVDVDTQRSGPGNQMQILAEALGYPYWYFGKSTDEKNGGQYGHGILSRYPIMESENVYFKVIGEGDHVRNYERHVLDVDGKELVFYNTHITVKGSESDKGNELREISVRMCEDEYAVLTGDMNMVPDNMERYINAKKLIVLNGDGGGAFTLNTFPAGKKPTTPIDNIIVSRSLDYYWNEDTNVGIEVNYTDNSDHNLIYTYVNFKE